MEKKNVKIPACWRKIKPGLPIGFPLSTIVIGMYSLQSLLGPGATCYWTGQLIYFFFFLMSSGISFSRKSPGSMTKCPELRERLAFPSRKAYSTIKRGKWMPPATGSKWGWSGNQRGRVYSAQRWAWAISMKPITQVWQFEDSEINPLVSLLRDKWFLFIILLVPCSNSQCSNN